MPPPSLSAKSLAARVWAFVRWGAVILVVLVIGGCVAENYRGHYVWNKYRREWQAKGEEFDLTALVPRAVPDDENFAATPFFAPYFDYTIDESDPKNPRRWRDKEAFERHQRLAASPSNLRLDKKAPESGRWQMGDFTDLRLWQEFFHGNTNFPFAPDLGEPASDVLAALQRYDPLLDEIRAASARPHSVFPVHYLEHYQALLPHLVALKNFAQVVELRAVAHLEAGHSAEALQDVRLGLRLAESLKSEKLLISALVRMALAQITLQPAWEGLARRRWSQAEVAELQATLAGLNILEDYGPVMRMERAAAIYFLDELSAGKFRPAPQEFDGDESTDYAKIRYLPRGIFRHNQLSIARLYQNHLLPVVDVDEHYVDVQQVNSVDVTFGRQPYHPYRIFANLLLRPVSRTPERFARAQAWIDLAVVACAVERHRLAEGRYPNALADLTPKFIDKIPPDVITSEPLKYRVAGDGFLLYSVGWNESDDGGIVGLNARKSNFDPRKGDWVWSYTVESRQK